MPNTADHQGIDESPDQVDPIAPSVSAIPDTEADVAARSTKESHSVQLAPSDPQTPGPTTHNTLTESKDRGDTKFGPKSGPAESSIFTRPSLSGSGMIDPRIVDTTSAPQLHSVMPSSEHHGRITEAFESNAVGIQDALAAATALSEGICRSLPNLIDARTDFVRSERILAKSRSQYPGKTNFADAATSIA